jgi:hypothetical protein
MLIQIPRSSLSQGRLINAIEALAAARAVVLI